MCMPFRGAKSTRQQESGKLPGGINVADPPPGTLAWVSLEETNPAGILLMRGA